jgi:hypothetical protein
MKSFVMISNSKRLLQIVKPNVMGEIKSCRSFGGELSLKTSSYEAKQEMEGSH